MINNENQRQIKISELSPIFANAGANGGISSSQTIEFTDDIPLSKGENTRRTTFGDLATLVSKSQDIKDAVPQYLEEHNKKESKKNDPITSKTKVFDTLEALERWLGYPSNVNSLNIGDRLIVRDNDIPNFYWGYNNNSELEKIPEDKYIRYFTNNEKVIPLSSLQDGKLKDAIKVGSGNVSGTINAANLPLVGSAASGIVPNPGSTNANMVLQKGSANSSPSFSQITNAHITNNTGTTGIHLNKLSNLTGTQSTTGISSGVVIASGSIIQLTGSLPLTLLAIGTLGSQVTVTGSNISGSVITNAHIANNTGTTGIHPNKIANLLATGTTGTTSGVLISSGSIVQLTGSLPLALLASGTLGSQVTATGANISGSVITNAHIANNTGTTGIHLNKLSNLNGTQSTTGISSGVVIASGSIIQLTGSLPLTLLGNGSLSTGVYLPGFNMQVATVSGAGALSAGFQTIGGVKQFDQHPIFPTEFLTRPVNFVIGNAAEGHVVGKDCDILLDGLDDADKINYAIYMCSWRGGGKIIIREGVYNIKRTIYLWSDDTTIEGMGGESTILCGCDNLESIIEINGDNSKVSNLKLENKNQYNVDKGICIKRGSNNTVSEVICSNSSRGFNYCIYIDGVASYGRSSNNNKIINNICSNKNHNQDNGYGIYVNNSNENSIIGNTCSNNNNDNNEYGFCYGVYIEGGNYNLISENIINNSSKGDNTGIYVNGSNNTVSNNTCSNNSSGSSNNIYGITIDGSNNTATGNTCSNTSGGGNSYGIYVSANSSNITGNICSNKCIAGGSSYGIFIIGANSSNITGNICSNSSNSSNYGIYLSGGSNNTITGNTCSNSSSSTNYGIYLVSSSNNTITGNTCSNTSSGSNSYGIYVSANSSNITGNTCSNTSGSSSNISYGIYVNCSNSIINSNIIANKRATASTQTTSNTFAIYFSTTCNYCSVIGNNLAGVTRPNGSTANAGAAYTQNGTSSATMPGQNATIAAGNATVGGATNIYGLNIV